MRVACVVLFATSLSMSPMFPLGLEREEAQEATRQFVEVDASRRAGHCLDPCYALHLWGWCDNPHGTFEVFNAVMSLLMGLLSGQAPTLNAAGPSTHDPHVRALEKDADRVLAKGLAKSPTFRRLVSRLERSDVIVYVRLGWDLPLHMGGRLHFLATHGESRYLVVDLNRALARSALVALLGHELQHAVEVAEARDVTSSADLRGLYRRVGVQTGPDRYDSIAARRAGYDVLREEASGRHAEARAASAMQSLTEAN